MGIQLSNFILECEALEGEKHSLTLGESEGLWKDMERYRKYFLKHLYKLKKVPAGT